VRDDPDGTNDANAYADSVSIAKPDGYPVAKPIT
jgi:hypothetical protein